ncbi:MAG TPA: MBL fold metallo-hydrolase [Gemmatimonadaceae bacterium]|nr:MBL fold metallo-hydrolase [Gemmatimonadaceae bacterium]
MRLTAALLAVASAALSACSSAEGATRRPAPFSPPGDTLVVRVLDVGQGDATLITDGGSRVLIDGGPDQARMGALLDSLGLDGQTIDVVILTHQHADHLVGLRALFESRRHIGVRYFFENGDAYTAANLRHLRDSIAARVGRHELVYRDTDDPCANGQPICTITLKGGAKIHIMRPDPDAHDPNDRSAAVKLVAADSTFSMWIAGDAEQDAIGWFLNEAHYDRDPGMHVDVLKADHHGSCNGVTSAYLDALRPSVVVASVGAVNSYGHMHAQAKAMYAAHREPWYRTDEDGTIEIRAPGERGARYSIRARTLRTDLSGPSDRASTQAQCNPIP